MEIKITLFITLLAYAVVISQSFFYLLAMGNVCKNMKPATYIESRKLLDDRLSKTLAAAYYTTLLASIALTAFCVTNPSGLLFISSIISLIALVTDMVLAIKGNQPLNKIINTWTTSEYPMDWEYYRNRWFVFYNTRQAVNLTGFVVLVAGVIFGC
ncbi:hypothetical protein LZZ85_21420 [Terrimonas sp. NA20]|uniref:DUF1772 domain-containing protein n=1 Tax=Terrimonas ginsenosidimutans TaxID=2908004 RepID=A0ABS9KX17_9BACT|nr:hypothetical protein [Terrimonas ginsenosidimutans]MCG2616871.1 hypothetical protein [Terrimonas ginsenosidimutans]